MQERVHRGMLGGTRGDGQGFFLRVWVSCNGDVGFFVDFFFFVFCFFPTTLYMGMDSCDKSENSV